MTQCPSSNRNIVDQSSFWTGTGLDWDTHRIGWVVAGSCTIATLLISSISIISHCRNYTNPTQQRQILRILYMPPVYGIISFFSYRYFRDYTYYSLIEVVYEAITLSAFLLLLIDYVAIANHKAKGGDNFLGNKDKRPLMFPFCCWRYRPTKPYFMYTLKWSVLQYVVVRPAISIAGIICQALDILCETESFNVHFANVYLEAIDFVSISVALYGLILFYNLTKTELQGCRPLAKFLAIKLIVMFTFYQSFVFSALQGRAIHGTKYWTSTNIADGLNALAICIEMIFFSIFMWWAYSPNEYNRGPGKRPTSIWRPLWDSINYSDFAHEILSSAAFFLGCGRTKTPANNGVRSRRANPDFGTAFGLQDHKQGHPVHSSGRRSVGSDISNHELVLLPK